MRNTLDSRKGAIIVNHRVSSSVRVILIALSVVLLTACSSAGSDRQSSPNVSASGTGSIAGAPAKVAPSYAAPASEVIGLDPARSEAQEILDAIRSPLLKAFGQPVSLDAGFVNQWGTYAAVQGVALDSNGREVDYSHIARYAEAVKAGAFDPQLYALLRNDDGRWRVLKWEVGATDAAFVPWSEQFGLPSDIWTPHQTTALRRGPRLEPLHVTVKNESTSALQGLSIRPKVGKSVDLPRISPGSSTTVRVALPESSENVLFLVDSGARRYILLSYFEGDPRGGVSVTITGGTPGDLQGIGVDQSGYSPRGRFKLE